MATFFPRLRAGYLRFTARACVVMRKASEQLNGLLAIGLIGLVILPFNGLTAERVLTDLSYYGREHPLGCLALNLYRERATEAVYGFNEPDEGLLAIGWVVKNRLSLGFRQAGQAAPQTICDVVWAPDQFSWTSWSDTDKFFVAEQNRAEFVRAFNLAYAVLRESEEAKAIRALIGPADHYFNPEKVQPRWAKGMKLVGTVGFHEFYVETNRNVSARRALEQTRMAMGE